MKSLGSINAANVAVVLDYNGVKIGECMDTPNNAAYALMINPLAFSVSTPFSGVWLRKDLEKRFYGLDAEYHARFVTWL
mgnify:CR=1 FL=1